MRRRRSVERLTPIALQTVRSGASAVIARAASISRSRRRRFFSDVLDQFEACDLTLQLAILDLELMITTLEFVLRDKLALADRKRLRIQIATIAFASPGVEL